MKLTIPARSIYQQVASFNGRASDATMADLFERFGKNTIHVVLKIEAMQETAWAFSLQGEEIKFADCYAKIDIGPKGHVTVFHAPRQAAEVIDVCDVNAALEVLSSRNDCKMVREDGGKRLRLNAAGDLMICGTHSPFSAEQISESRPVIYTIKSASGHGYFGFVTDN